MKYKVNENCIGCGICASMCPEVFKMTDAGVSEAIKENVPSELAASAGEAKESCPAEAIEEI